LLPAESWQRVIGRLSDHYGVDASIDPARARELLAWLQANAAAGRRAVAPPQDRITQGAWFLREHKELGTAVWQRGSVRQPSNCGACHARADEGSFRERDIVIPK
jgi:nitrate/TMAO reductase-like tetraheme cytochrome c subunit